VVLGAAVWHRPALLPRLNHLRLVLGGTGWYRVIRVWHHRLKRGTGGSDWYWQWGTGIPACHHPQLRRRQGRPFGGCPALLVRILRRISGAASGPHRCGLSGATAGPRCCVRACSHAATSLGGLGFASCTARLLGPRAPVAHCAVGCAQSAVLEIVSFIITCVMWPGMVCSSCQPPLERAAQAPPLKWARRALPSLWSGVALSNPQRFNSTSPAFVPCLFSLFMAVSAGLIAQNVHGSDWWGDYDMATFHASGANMMHGQVSCLRRSYGALGLCALGVELVRALHCMASISPHVLGYVLVTERTRLLNSDVAR
jgi:hypothetical protein